jgi:hypothetical protein
MINYILGIKGLPPQQSFALTFSDKPFPGVDAELEAIGERTYFHKETGMTGWLCSALRAYFPTPPPKIFIKVGG